MQSRLGSSLQTAGQQASPADVLLSQVQGRRCFKILSNILLQAYLTLL